MTRALAWAAAMDAGNHSMRKGGRTAWSEDDYNTVVETFDRLWPIERDIGSFEFVGTNLSEDELR